MLYTKKGNKAMRKHKALKAGGIIPGSLLALAVHAGAHVYTTFRHSFDTITRLDNEGLLYYVNYTGDYYRSPAALVPSVVRGAGCSAFSTRATDLDGTFITCRNMDYPHFDKEGRVTGLNAVVRLNPKGKYRSVNVADANWISALGFDYVRGALDNGKTPTYPMVLIPWMCLDGLNEKGLCVNILALDVKDGEKAVAQKLPGKKTVVITELLRLLLDNCADVGEAITYAGNVNMWNISDNDYHLFLTDAEGNSAVLEWRFNEMRITRQDAVTNCYVSSDDPADCYMDGKLHEKAIEKAESLREYHMGFGHGYGRYNTLITGLDRFRDSDIGYTSRMTVADAEELISSVWQICDGTGMTSHTQYSVIYENENRKLTVRTMAEPDNRFEFTVEK